MNQYETITKIKATELAQAFNEDELRTLSHPFCNFDKRIDDTSYATNVDETLIKIGNNEFVYFPSDTESGTILKGDLQDVLDNMDALC